MDDRYLILSIAKREIEKKLEKAHKEVEKKSEKLRQMCIDKVSYTKRRAAKFRLERACEERDRWEKRLELVNEWMEGLK
ncbi:hypothetical protein [Caloramator sp. ALD01]|uniref:hypothetical protein n=1 Tax=Caloramator sp. ALD01 TaxID=1031288 RepID=UPI000422E091|nr:hypothetical protein [Caloramator sp. ALD01]